MRHGLRIARSIPPEDLTGPAAGEPHRGRITEAEKELVRSHLDEINKRLSDGGLREIDPGDPTMKESYGL